MLDDANVLKQRDPAGALTIAGAEYEQVKFRPDIIDSDNDGRQITSIVVAGMGGSALAAVLVKSWLKSELKIPISIVRSYGLPLYISQNTLVIASSYSGNTEEVLSCLNQAKEFGAQIAIIASGGLLINDAQNNHIAHVILPSGVQPRMAVINNLCALVALLANFGLVSSDKLDEISSLSDWLQAESAKWASDIPTDNNYAKQLALVAVGKTAVFYGGPITAPVAYKWKISWNENAKNVAFWDAFPEFNHNEFIGWTGHPVEKPFAIFDIVSNLEHIRIQKRFEVTDRLLSGYRPKSTVINLQGKTAIEQLLWGSILADFTSIYLAILNNVNPTTVPLIEKLKIELALS